MTNKKIEVRDNIADPDIKEVFLKNKHVGDVNFFEGIWWWRQPSALSWWRASDFDDGVEQILGINKV